MKANELTTIANLKELESSLLNILHEIKTKLESNAATETNNYLRSREVRTLLGNISEGKLTALRKKRALTYIDVNGTYLYPYKELQAYLAKKTVPAKPKKSDLDS